MKLWRICAERYGDTAFSGRGSMRFPGRWHKGLPVVYTATSLPLAAIELFVNLETLVEPDALVSVAAELPDDLTIPAVDATRLNAEWWREKDASCLTVGMDWLRATETLCLSVPSAAILGERNILLNPGHADFQRVRVGTPQPFRFDPRMFRRA